MSARLRPFRSDRSEIPSLLPDSWSIATWRHPVVLADSLEHAADIGEILRERAHELRTDSAPPHEAKKVEASAVQKLPRPVNHGFAVSKRPRKTAPHKHSITALP